MTVQLTLPPELEARLRREAERRGQPAESVALRLLEQHLPPPDDRRAARQEICDLLQPILRDETGLWIADYVRLRFRARLPAAPK